MMLGSAQFHQTAVEVLCKGLKTDSVTLENDLLGPDTGSGTERLRNFSRRLTLLFKYPRNECHYISFKHSMFHVYICLWISKIHDCCARHSASLNLTF